MMSTLDKTLEGFPLCFAIL